MEHATERRQLDPFEKTMASFLSGRGWLVVDVSKYQKDCKFEKNINNVGVMSLQLMSETLFHVLR